MDNMVRGVSIVYNVHVCMGVSEERRRYRKKQKKRKRKKTKKKKVSATAGPCE